MDARVVALPWLCTNGLVHGEFWIEGMGVVIGHAYRNPQKDKYFELGAPIICYAPKHHSIAFVYLLGDGQ
jgi:hypothetical protein